VFFWGDPAPYVESAHHCGTKVIVQVGSVEEARAVAQAGVDGVIAQGEEAGGHVKGTIALSTLVPAMVEAIQPVPVIASGGAGSLEHLYEGLVEGCADAVLAASIFHFGTHTIAEAKAYLCGRGVEVRSEP